MEVGDQCCALVTAISAVPWSLNPHGTDLVPIVQEAGWTPGLVWMGAGNLAISPSTVQPIVQRYNDRSVLAHQIHPSVSHVMVLKRNCVEL
jgi:hypothetical protein